MLKSSKADLLESQRVADELNAVLFFTPALAPPMPTVAKNNNVSVSAGDTSVPAGSIQKVQLTSGIQSQQSFSSNLVLPRPISLASKIMLSKVARVTLNDKQTESNAGPPKVTLALTEEEENDPNVWKKFEAAKKEKMQELKEKEWASKKADIENADAPDCRKKFRVKQPFAPTANGTSRLRR
jgi:hypothetical protein